MAIENSMLGAAHAAANPLTAHFNIIHGQAVGMMLPVVVDYNSADAETRLRAARGLYAQDPTHPRALAILKSDGNSQDRRRLEQASQRNAYAKRAAAQRMR